MNFSFFFSSLYLYKLFYILYTWNAKKFRKICFVSRKYIIFADFIGVTGITDLTLQDVYGALIHLTQRGLIPTRGRSLWSKSQFECLWREMMDGDSFYKNTIRDFKNAVAETRYRRTHRQPVEIPEEPDDADNYNSEEDMNAMSDMLLAADDVWN